MFSPLNGATACRPCSLRDHFGVLTRLVTRLAFMRRDGRVPVYSYWGPGASGIDTALLYDWHKRAKACSLLLLSDCRVASVSFACNVIAYCAVLWTPGECCESFTSTDMKAIDIRRVFDKQTRQRRPMDKSCYTWRCLPGHGLHKLDYH